MTGKDCGCGGRGSSCSCGGGCGGTCGCVSSGPGRSTRLRSSKTSSSPRAPLRLDAGEAPECGTGWIPPATRLRARGNVKRAGRATAGSPCALVAGVGAVALRTTREGVRCIDGTDLRRARGRPGVGDSRRGTLLFAGPVSGRGSLLKAGSGGGTLLGGRETPPVVYEYRDTQFTVPLSWTWGYEIDLARQHARGDFEGVGRVSGTEDFLAYAWPEFRAAAAASGDHSETWFSMLGCYNLPRETMPDALGEWGAMFWHAGWGPPYQVYALTNQVVLAYSRLIEDVCTGHAYCEGYGDWVSQVLRGRGTRDLRDVGPCTVTMRFVNAETADATVRDTGRGVDVVGCGDLAGTAYSCAEGFVLNEAFDLVSGVMDPGQAWDVGLPAPRFDGAANAWIPAGVSTHPTNSFAEPPYGPGGRAYVYDLSWTVTQRPELLAWDGFVCDWILYLGRMAYDRSRDFSTEMDILERKLLAQSGQELARYALRILAERGRVLVHELGHVHNGTGGHCSRGECCFQFASLRWRCAVIATLGLPLDTGTANSASSWTRTVSSTNESHCYADYSAPTASGPPTTSCTLHSPGEVAGGWSFACSTCGDPLVIETERVLR